MFRQLISLADLANTIIGGGAMVSVKTPLPLVVIADHCFHSPAVLDIG